MNLSDRDRARFWAKVDRETTPAGCWPWTGKLNAEGRGRFTAGHVTDYAYRVAWQTVHGEIQPSAVVRHLCGNPACCRPDHLDASDQRQNNLDTVAHGRHRSAKLSGARVRQLRERYSRDRPALTDLATEHGVSESAVSAALTGRTWPRAGGPVHHSRKRRLGSSDDAPRLVAEAQASTPESIRSIRASTSPKPSSVSENDSGVAPPSAHCGR